MFADDYILSFQGSDKVSQVPSGLMEWFCVLSGQI
jgi:hypothetical protein